ncbi:GGDEF domain-containing protein [Aerococcus urinaeequi]|uniref:GGDEF domain-containing protein n=1 Tax=Aerococcus urinaeequi TaxID=51665 RepID=UPI003D6B8EC6
MIVNVLANMAIVFMDIYLVWRWRYSIQERRNPINNRKLFIGLQTAAGVCLMMSSFIIEGVRFDFRSVLFAYTMVYLDKEIAHPTIVLVAICRFFFGDLILSGLYLLMVLAYILLSSSVFDRIKAKHSEFFQLWLLAMMSIVITAPISIIRLEDPSQVFSTFLLLAVLSSLFIYVSYHFTNDLDKLYQSSLHDSLTALYNARKLDEDLGKISESNHSYSLLILDINNFKNLNDIYGHLVGDKALEEIGIVLNNLKSDLFDYYRYGGEEFVGLVFDWTGQKTLDLAESIHDRIAKMPLFSEEGEPLKITVSIGVARRKPHEDMKISIMRPDQALYQAKHLAKNQTVNAKGGLIFD